MAMCDTPPISGITADAYRAALRVLVEMAQKFLAEDDEHADSGPLVRQAGAVHRHLRDDGFRPRERMTLAEANRGALRRFAEAVEEFDEAREFDGGALGLRVWDTFDDTVRGAARGLERDDIEWAPQDDSNPFKTTAIPVPDPTVLVGPPDRDLHQGDYLKSEWDDEPRQILAGPDSRGMVRVSDKRDGSANWGGYWVAVADIGKSYAKWTVGTEGS